MGRREVADSTNFITCRFDLDGVWRELSSRFCEQLGYSVKEMQALTFPELIHPENKAVELEIFEKVSQGEEDDFGSKVRFVKKSGEPVVYYSSGVLIRDTKGKPDHILCHLINLTKQHEVNQKLEEREQQFDSLFKHNPHPVYYFDLEGNFEDVNDKLVEFTGYNKEELLNLNYADFIVEEDLDRTREHFQKAVNGQAGQYEIRVKVKGGDEKEIRVTKFPKLSGDEVTGVFGILQDITREKIAKRRLERSEQRWQQLVEQNPQPVQIVQDGKIVFINQAGAEYYGSSSPQELVGKPILDFTHPDFKDHLLQRKDLLEQNQPVEPDEHKIVLLNGEERFIEAHSIPISYKGENAIQTVIHDITELKEKQRVIGKSLKEKEMLLQEIHHRVKNNLAMISSMLELQIMQSTEDAAINALRDSQLRIQSIAIIHEKLYQSDSLDKIGFDKYLQELVESIKKMYSDVDGKVETIYDLDQVSLNINQAIPCSLLVNEVVVNCFKHAFPNYGKGTLHLKLDYDEPHLKLEIGDDGIGLPEDFDIQKQDSLGMTLIQALSSQLEGEISFSDSSENGGTEFRLSFRKNSEN